MAMKHGAGLKAEEIAPALVVVAMLVTLAGMLAWTASRTPVVTLTWPGKRCVAVEGAGTCEDLPRRYSVVYVRGDR